MPLTLTEQNEIRAHAEAGMHPSALAKAYGVTPRRVYQLLSERPPTDEELAEALAARSAHLTDLQAELFGYLGASPFQA